jgi:hypothetical protein
MHPQPRVQSKKAHERSHYRFTELVRPSLRDGFNAYNVLSPVTGSFATVAGGIASADLIPASRDQDHTPWPSARVHRIPSRVS